MDPKERMREIREALKNGNSKKIINLIDSGEMEINTVTVFGSWLHIAARHNQLEIIKLLVDRGIDINANGGTFGSVALLDAASNGNLEICQYLFSKGSNLEISEPDKNPLFGAIYNGHLKIVKWLVDIGFDTEVKYSGTSMNNMGALEFATRQGQSEIATFLEQVRENKLNKPKSTVTKAAAHSNSLQNVKLTIGNSDSIDWKLLRKLIRSATKECFDSLRRSYPQEDFYGLALTTVDDVVFINPSMNTEKGYQKLVDILNEDSVEKIIVQTQNNSYSSLLLGDYRWNAFEWKFHNTASEHFDAINRAINNRGIGLSQGTVEIKAGILAAMVLALSDLVCENYFGSNENRNNIMLFCSIANSTHTAWFEQDSSGQLNTPENHKRFQDERIKYITEGDSQESDYASPLRQEYLKHFIK